jgi:hypothetical protein
MIRTERMYYKPRTSTSGYTLHPVTPHPTISFPSSFPTSIPSYYQLMVASITRIGQQLTHCLVALPPLPPQRLISTVPIYSSELSQVWRLHRLTSPLFTALVPSLPFYLSHPKHCYIASALYLFTFQSKDTHSQSRTGMGSCSIPHMNDTPAVKGIPCAQSLTRMITQSHKCKLLLTLF